MSFVSELKRRNVFKVAVAYAIVGWLLVQIADVFFPALQLPDWTVTLVAALLILGFPVALLLSWAYELTPEGVKRTESVPRSESITGITGRKLDFVIIGFLGLAVVFMFVENYLPEPGPFAGAAVDPASLGPTPQTTSTDVVETNGTTPVRDSRSFAALPFSSESAAEENAEFLANGIHDELLTQLAKVGSLKVISRTSVMEYQGSSKNMRQIGEELGVATLLEGRVQRAGDMVRITVQLIDAATDDHLWAETFDEALTAENVFAIQTEIALSIAEALEATLAPDEVARLNRVPTQSTRAWEFYQSARRYADDPDEETALPLAVQQFRRAVEEDDKFAVAWARLSHVYSELGEFDLARETVERAFELAPDLPEGHFALAEIHYWNTHDYVRALQEYGIAERGMPRSAEIISSQAITYSRMGRWDEAFAAWDRAFELDPRNVEELLLCGWAHAINRDYAQAEQFFDRALEIAPESAQANARLAWLAMNRDGDVTLARAMAESPPVDIGAFRHQLGWEAALYDHDYAKALSYLDGWEEGNQEGRPISIASMYGVTYRLAGQPERAVAYFQQAREGIERALEMRPDDFRLHVALGEVLAGLGERDAAVRSALHAVELMPVSADTWAGSINLVEAITRVLLPAQDYDTALELLDTYLAGPGWFTIEGLLPDPRLDPIRDDPRFQALVEKYRRK